MTLLYCKSRQIRRGMRSDWRPFGSQRQKASGEWAEGRCLDPQDSQAGRGAGCRAHLEAFLPGRSGKLRQGKKAALKGSPFLSLALRTAIFRAVMGVKVFLLPPDIDLINCRTHILQTHKVSAEKNSKQWALVEKKNKGV